MRHNAHPPISLKIKGLLGRIWCYRFFRALPSFEWSEVLGLDDPGCTRAGLPPLKIATLDHAQRRHFVDADDVRRSVERDLAALGPLAVAEAVDPVMFAEAAHPLFGQPLPCPVGLPERLSRRAILASAISRASSRTRDIVSSGTRG